MVGAMSKVTHSPSASTSCLVRLMMSASNDKPTDSHCIRWGDQSTVPRVLWGFLARLHNGDKAVGSQARDNLELMPGRVAEEDVKGCKYPF